MIRRLGSVVVAGLIATAGLAVAAGPASAQTGQAAASARWVCHVTGSYTGTDGRKHNIVTCVEA